MKFRNASRSRSWACTKLCAIVPATGMPKACPAATFDVASTPATYAARDAASEASAPCACRKPKSTTDRPSAAATTRAALEATAVGSWTRLSSRVSTS